MGVNITGGRGINIEIRKALIINYLQSKGVNMVCKNPKKQAPPYVRQGLFLYVYVGLSRLTFSYHQRCSGRFLFR